jgi:hypothetical protein
VVGEEQGKENYQALYERCTTVFLTQNPHFLVFSASFPHFFWAGVSHACPRDAPSLSFSEHGVFPKNALRSLRWFGIITLLRHLPRQRHNLRYLLARDGSIWSEAVEKIAICIAVTFNESKEGRSGNRVGMRMVSGHIDDLGDWRVLKDARAIEKLKEKRDKKSKLEEDSLDTVGNEFSDLEAELSAVKAPDAEEEGETVVEDEEASKSKIFDPLKQRNP